MNKEDGNLDDTRYVAAEGTPDCTSLLENATLLVVLFDGTWEKEKE